MLINLGTVCTSIGSTKLVHEPHYHYPRLCSTSAVADQCGNSENRCLQPFIVYIKVFKNACIVPLKYHRENSYKKHVCNTTVK